MDIGQFIKMKRTDFNFTQEELGKKLTPPVTKATVNKWEDGTTKNLKTNHIQQLATIFGVSPSDMFCFNDSESDIVRIPVLGRVVAGIPIEACEDIIDYVGISKKEVKSDNLFALKVRGDSMKPRIMENDTLIVRQQNDAESGDVVIALIDGQDSTCKKLIKHKDGISLISFNQEYAPMFFTNEEILNRPVAIIGKVIENRQKF